MCQDFKTSQVCIQSSHFPISVFELTPFNSSERKTIMRLTVTLRLVHCVTGLFCIITSLILLDELVHASWSLVNRLKDSI